MNEPEFIRLPPDAVTRATEMQEAANARSEGRGDILLALAQLVTVVGFASDQLARAGMPATADALVRMADLVCRVTGAGFEELKPYMVAIRDDSKDCG